MSNTPFAAIRSPFQALRDLLGDAPPGEAPIDMTIGEPRHGVPGFATEIIQQTRDGFGKYPPIQGTLALRQAIASWLTRRYSLPEGAVDQDRDILPLNGTREGLVSALFIAKAREPKDRPAVLMPNPFYQAYYAAAICAGCEPVLLPAGEDTGFLPDLKAIPADVWARTIAFYLASPANPQGVIASDAYLREIIEKARAYGFYLFSDECYSEIYRSTPPQGALAVAHRVQGNFERVLVFNSLSKRSNAPGLRSGFIAGDAAFLKDYMQFRNVACPQVPLPIQAASAALWADEAHVETSRALYRDKFCVAEQALSRVFSITLPEGGIFLWLNLSNFNGGEAAAVTIWKGCGVKILPGAFLAQPDAQFNNPAYKYARLALVDPLDVVGQAFDRLARFAG